MTEISRRKSDHLRIVTEGRGAQDRLDSGFDQVRSASGAARDLTWSRRYGNAVPGRSSKARRLAMTGGPEEAERINLHTPGVPVLITASPVRRIAAHRGGGGRYRRPGRQPPVRVRPRFRSRIGAVQLNYGFGVAQAQRAVIGDPGRRADPAPEPAAGGDPGEGGDRNFAALLPRIEELATSPPVPKRRVMVWYRLRPWHVV